MSAGVSVLHQVLTDTRLCLWALVSALLIQLCSNTGAALTPLLCFLLRVLIYDESSHALLFFLFNIASEVQSKNGQWLPSG